MLAATQRVKLTARKSRSWQSARHYQYFGDGTMRHQRQDSTWDKIIKVIQPPVQPGTLIVVRHGESEWNAKRLFTGWVDTDLTDRGIREIEHASRLLLERGYTVDITYTSLLKRAVRSSWIMLNEINQIYTPVVKTWRLNERMYGALEGHSKPGLANLYGGEVVQKWRAGMEDKPPPMSPDHPYWHGFERKYANLSSDIMPLSESLQDTIDRTTPLWDTNIVTDLKAGKNVMIMAHRNSIKGILKLIDGISNEDLQQVGVPNGIPLVYKFDMNMKPIKHEHAAWPLSGVWLGKKGLLRAALEQEAELSKRIEGYNYTKSANTAEFYYHAPSMGHNSRYTIRDLTLDTNTTSGGGSGEKKHTSAQEVTVKAGELDGNENSYIYGGTDANLVRKLTLLDQERKLFDLVDHSAIATVKENVDEVGVVNPDIYIDPRVILAPKMLEHMPSNTCSTPTGIVEVDIQRLNQTNYFANTCSDTITNLAIDDAAPAEYTNKTSLVKPICKRNNAILNPILSRPLLVIIRHGKTEHNKLGLFTGWEDAALSPEGRKEARTAGKLLKKHGFKFDVVYTSWLSRAIETAWLVLNELESLWNPIIKTWRLNERMYGALTGLSKKMIRQLYGDDQFKKWRRGYNEPPPAISSFSSAYPGNDIRYVKYVSDMPISWFESIIRSLAHGQVELHRKLPKTESLKDCMERTVPFFMNEIKPDSIDKGKNVLIASSENAIRGLLMHLCKIPEDRINAVEIPTGLPLIYDKNIGKIRLLQEAGPDGAITGEMLLAKYKFGDSPELLFDLTQIDVSLVETPVDPAAINNSAVTLDSDGKKTTLDGASSDIFRFSTKDDVEWSCYIDNERTGTNSVKESQEVEKTNTEDQFPTDDANFRANQEFIYTSYYDEYMMQMLTLTTLEQRGVRTQVSPTSKATDHETFRQQNKPLKFRTSIVFIVSICSLLTVSGLPDYELGAIGNTEGFTLNSGGSAVSAAGDFNGDGVDDMIIGVFWPNGNTGITYVVFGRKDGSNANMDLSSFSTGLTTGFRIYGAAPSDVSGFSISSAGDVNGDGIDDVIMGARIADPPGLSADSDAGIAYVIFGRRVTSPADAFMDMQLTTNPLGSNIGFRILGAAAGDFCGFSVSRAGDMNGDGLDDIIVSASEADAPGGRTNAGISYVIFGRNTTQNAQLFSDINLSLLSTPSIIGFRILGAAAYDQSGYSVSNAGDVNGDGISDVIIGAYLADPLGIVTGSNEGCSYVIFGRKVIVGVNDFTDIQLSTTTMDASVGFRILGASADDQSGVAVSGAGDVNGDGIDDVIVGAYVADPPNRINGGICYVIFGRRLAHAGVAPFGDVELTTDAQEMPGNVGFRILGARESDILGGAVAAAGDVNGDGVDDVIVGARYADPAVGREDAGISYVIYGRKSIAGSVVFGDIDLAQPVSPVGFRMLSFASIDYSGRAVSRAGDVNGDGGMDVIVGTLFGPSYIIYGTPPIPTSQPSCQPSGQPSFQPSRQPFVQPSRQPTRQPTSLPSSRPSSQPSAQPSSQPSTLPSRTPTKQPAAQPSAQPSIQPSAQPTHQPSRQSSAHPTSQPSNEPSAQPSRQPSNQPFALPSAQPSLLPTIHPSGKPSAVPSGQPVAQPTTQPSLQPSLQPSRQPTDLPSSYPSEQPSTQPSMQPTTLSSAQPTSQPTKVPSSQPSMGPTSQPSSRPSMQPSSQPTKQPSQQPSNTPSSQPSAQPSVQPSSLPSAQPSSRPSIQPSTWPTCQPSCLPSTQPSAQPTNQPSAQPSRQTTGQPTAKPSEQPLHQPSSQPSTVPTVQPTVQPSNSPSFQPTAQPATSPTNQPSSQPSLQPSRQPTSQTTKPPSKHAALWSAQRVSRLMGEAPIWHTECQWCCEY